MTGVRITHIGGPTALIEAGGWRILTDPTFDPPGKRYHFGWGSVSRKTAGPAITAQDLGPIDAVLVSHHQHGDNLDPVARELLPTWGTLLTTRRASRSLGHGVGLAAWDTHELTHPDRPAITVTATPCRHGNALFAPISGPVVGFALAWEGQTDGQLWVTGDTVVYDGLQEVPKRLTIGTVVVHLGSVRFRYLSGPAKYTMSAADAATFLPTVDPQVIVPVHYEGWSHFAEGRAAAEPVLAASSVGDRVRWLDPGESVKV